MVYAAIKDPSQGISQACGRQSVQVVLTWCTVLAEHWPHGPHTRCVCLFNTCMKSLILLQCNSREVLPEKQAGAEGHVSELGLGRRSVSNVLL